jgi:hypothetical protein
MKTMLRWTSVFCMLSVSTMASAGSLPTSFTVGYNEAWVEQYGFWLASNPLFGYAPSAFNNGSLWSTMFSGMAQGNAKIVRIFLFPALQGICVNPLPDPARTICPNGATQGLTSDFLVNLTTLFSLVRTYNSLPSTRSPIKLYITALNANDANLATQAQCPALASPSICQALYSYYQNLFSNSAATTAYENIVLGPILRLMSQYQDVIYGFDLIDEIEAAINAGYFSDSWIGARAWLRNMTEYVTHYAPWLPVTSTAGGGYAVLEVILGLFSELDLNFYDVHIYADNGQYAGQLTALTTAELCFRTKEIDQLPIVLGEYGQKSQCTPSGAPSDPCDTLQTATTAIFLKGAKSSCFSSALAWKYEALNTSAPWLSYLYIAVTGTPPPPQLVAPPCPSPQSTPVPSISPTACARPAYTIIETFCQQNGC